jgi:toxin ParE1/3/4
VTLPVVLRAEAEVEFDEAFDYYEENRPGHGLEFMAEVQRVFDLIGDNPRLYSVALGDVRKGVVRRFPFFISIGTMKITWK